MAASDDAPEPLDVIVVIGAVAGALRRARRRERASRFTRVLGVSALALGILSCGQKEQGTGGSGPTGTTVTASGTSGQSTSSGSTSGAGGAPPQSVVCFYVDPNYQGQSFCVGLGSADATAQWNGVVSSVKVTPGYKAELFPSAGEKGRDLTLIADATSPRGSTTMRRGPPPARTPTT
jgi:hypothetical protein